MEDYIPMQHLQHFDRKATSVFDFPHVWGIFKPFFEHQTHEVFITTWGIADPDTMDIIVKQLNARRSFVRIIVGYDKTHHNMVDLRNRLLKYKALGWVVHVMPGMHLKIWAFGAHAYVGSCNFVPSTIHNYMHPTNVASLQNIMAYYWVHSNFFDSTTKLKMIPGKVRYQPSV